MCESTGEEDRLSRLRESCSRCATCVPRKPGIPTVMPANRERERASERRDSKSAREERERKQETFDRMCFSVRGKRGSVSPTDSQLEGRCRSKKERERGWTSLECESRCMAHQQLAIAMWRFSRTSSHSHQETLSACFAASAPAFDVTAATVWLPFLCLFSCACLSAPAPAAAAPSPCARTPRQSIHPLTSGSR